MRIKSGFVLRKIVDEWMIIPTGNRLVDFNGIMSLNETSAFIWDKLADDISFENLVNSVVNEFDVPTETARQDLVAIIKQLYDYGVMEND